MRNGSEVICLQVLFLDILKGGCWVIKLNSAEQLSYGYKTLVKLGRAPIMFIIRTLGRLFENWLQLQKFPHVLLLEFFGDIFYFLEKSMIVKVSSILLEFFFCWSMHF